MIEPWGKAAECKRAIEACDDPERKQVLKNLRMLWVALAAQKATGASDWNVHAEQAHTLHVEIVSSLPHTKV